MAPNIQRAKGQLTVTEIRTATVTVHGQIYPPMFVILQQYSRGVPLRSDFLNQRMAIKATKLVKRKRKHIPGL